MKCHILFSGKNKKNISKYHLLKILPRVQSVKMLSVHASILHFYAPNFEEVGGAYCFWDVCACVLPSVTLFDA